jgi:hypothetical protein
MINNDKIRAEHLRRAAFVYVRQSSLMQIRHHQESRRRLSTTCKTMRAAWAGARSS